MNRNARRYGLVALYRELWRLAHGHRHAFVGAFGLLLGSQAIKLAVPWLTAQAIDTIQRTGLGGVGTAGRWLLIGLCATAASWALHGPGRVLERNVALAVRRRLSSELVERLFALPLAWHDRHHSGETLQRLRQCTGALYDFAQSQFIYLQNAVRIVGPVIALWLIEPRVGAAALLGYALIASVIVGFDRRMIRLAHDENEAERRHAAAQLDAFGSIGTVKALRMARGLSRLIDDRLQAIYAPLRRSIAVNEWKWCSVDLLAAALAIGLVALYASMLVAGVASAAIAGGTAPAAADGTTPSLPIGRLFMVYEYAAQAGGVITALGAHLQGFARQRADYAAGDAIRDADVGVADDDPASAGTGATIGPEIARSPGWRALRIDELRFAHPTAERPRPDADQVLPATLAIDGLRLERGRRYAVMGPSGSGKSTLLRVLAGLYRAERIAMAIDPDGPRDDPDAVAGWLRAEATLVPQEAELFEGSLRDNLALATDRNGLAGDTAAMDAALRIAQVDRFVSADSGLEARVAERGSNFSGGQRQRIALARGLLAAGGSGLLLLDEPSAALDAETEAAVHAALFAAWRTGCVVSTVHRRELLRFFDEVILVDRGRLVGQGDPTAMLDRLDALAVDAALRRSAPPVDGAL